MKKHWIVGIVVAFLISNIAPAKGAESTPMLSTFTNLSAEADPHTGSANFGIPIQVEPGRGGIEPNLALAYNSSSPNGMLGLGWNLEIGSIKRSGKYGVPTYNNAIDTFVLVQNGSAQEFFYDPSAGFYRPKIEGAFLRIDYVSTSGGTWSARDRSGIEYTFGDANASREYNPNDSSKISDWKLSKVTDLHGNSMTFTYTRDNNVLYPQLIEYTANAAQFLANFAKVEFVYENRADDDAPKYNTGFLMNTQKRLKQILIKAANTLQRRYDLFYTQSPQTNRSLLTSITQVGNNGTTALPPVTFTYQNDALNYNLATLPATMPAGDHLWVARAADNYDRGHDTYGPVPPYGGGYTGFANLDWTTPQTASSGSWGGDGSWSTTPTGNLTINVVQDRAYHFTTYLYVNQATTLPVSYSPSDVVGTWINGNYAENSGQTWNLQAGLNLIDLTVYHQHASFPFTLNYDLANNVQVMNSEAPITAQLTGDFNADGFGDLARVDTSAGKLYVSLSSCLNFQPEAEWLSGIGTNDKVILGDFNGDGRTDVTVYRDATTGWDMYFSSGSALTSQGQWAIGFGTSGQRAAVDYNSDGSTDLVVIRSNGSTLWAEIAINTGTNFNPDIIADDILGTPSQTGSVGDFNGDGLMDYAVHTKSSGSWTIQTSPGAANQEPWNIWAAVSNFGAGYDPITADFNGDGFTDIGFYNYNSGKINYRRSNGSGFEPYEELPVTFGITVPTAQVTPVDLNGDTRLDIIVSNAVTGADEIAYSNSEVPDLLSTVANGIGGETAIAYGPAHVCDCSYLPFPIQVVNSVTTSNNIGDSYTTSYEYSEAVWDVDDREFRGFSFARVIDPNGNYSETNYLTDDIYKGRPSEQRTYDSSGNLFGKSVNTWDKQTIAAGIDFVFLKRKDNYVYDGNTTGRRTAEEFFYAETPQYGNFTKALQLGEVDLTAGTDIGADSRTIEMTYVKNTASDKWLLGLPNLTTVKDHSQAVVRKTWFYYDSSTDNNATPTKGLLTKKTDDGPGTSDPSTQYAYDAVGNLTSTTDPLGRVTSIAYDSDYKLFPLSTANALTHQVANQYYGVNGVSQNSGDGFKGLWGELKSTTDPNSKIGKKIYDEFGRPVKSISPLDSLTYPTVINEYETGSTYSAVTVKQRINHNQPGTIDTFQIYDGLGRLSFNKAKSETEGTYAVAGQTQYNSRGLPEKQYLPRFTTNPYEAINSSWPHTTTEYDAMGRVVKVTGPDAAYSTMSYNDWTSVAIDANGHKQESDYDAYGRLKTKREYSGADGRFASAYPSSSYSVYATTQYAYDSEGNLTQTTDASSNVTTIAYDILGRKTSMTDPDMGVWSYQYDLNGNLTKQTDAKNQVIDFAYDLLNRLVNKTDHAGLDVDYTYDNAGTTNSKGRLSYVQYGTGIEQTAFAYDELGRETSSSKTIGTTAYDVLRSYDALNRVAGIEYPDGESVYYGYNPAGQIEEVSNDSSLITGNPPPHVYLHAEGTDGSSVFTDSSPLARSVTANGNAQIDTAFFKAGSSSALFDGNGDYLTAPDSDDWFFGMDNFTIDFWIRPNATTEATAVGQFQDDYNRWDVRINGGGGGDQIYLISRYSSSVVLWSTPVGNQLSAGTWYHVAIVRNGTSWLCFINGVSKPFSGGNNSLNMLDLSGPLSIGRRGDVVHELNGSLDEVRISKGIALWTSNFTPPTGPVTTALLLHSDGSDGSTTFLDASEASSTVTTNGGAQIDTAQSKFGGASGLFDGTGDYLSVGSSDDWNFGSGNFTIDFWAKLNSTGATTLFDRFQNVSNAYALFLTPNNLQFFVEDSGIETLSFVANYSFSTGQWYHIALTRNGNNWRFFVDGALIGTKNCSAIANVATSSALRIGGGWDGGGGLRYVNGWMDEFRVTKGIALWTSNFTPPAAPGINALLLHADGSDGSPWFTDSSPSAHTVTAAGGAQIDTAQSKFGGASGLFDGTGDYLTSADSSDWYLGTDHFTIDFWVRPNANGEMSAVGQFQDNENRWDIRLNGGGEADQIYFITKFASSVVLWSTPTGNQLPMGTWTHVAIVRNGTSWMCFINGVSKPFSGGNNFLVMADLSSPLYIGTRGGGVYDFNGWLDEVRLFKGIALWTSDFTPPAGPGE